MNLKPRYENLKTKTLNDKSICKENRDWIKEVLRYQEKKGKRRNGLPVLDNACYKTLLLYIYYLKNTIKWFNKPVTEITKEDIERVYEGLEEGKISKSNGQIFKDKCSYYSKVFKSIPFEIIGKDKMAKEVIKYSVKNEQEVRFFENYGEVINKIVNTAKLQEHKTLIQVLADFMENVGAILQTEARDYRKHIDKETGEPEYHLVLRKEILKRSRTARTEINIFPKTIEFLDIALEGLKPNDKVFNFGLRQAEKMFDSIVKKTGIKLINAEKPTLKDIRSSGACFLIDEDWTSDEIRSRLGQKPSSPVLNKYLNYKAIGKRKPIKKIYQSNLKKLQDEIEQLRQAQKLKDKRFDNMKKDFNIIKKVLRKKYKKEMEQEGFVFVEKEADEILNI